MPGKEENPVWVPPDWHYVELAAGARPDPSPTEQERATRLADGSRLVVRGSAVVRLRADGEEEIVPASDEVIFGDTLFIPPLGAANRTGAG